MPPLGRHYKDVWQDEDAGISNSNGLPNPHRSISGLGLNDGSSSANLPPPLPSPISGDMNGLNSIGGSSSNNQMLISAPAYPPENATRFDPRQLRDEHLGNYEIARAGPLTERVLAALVPSKSLPNSDLNMGVGDGQGQDVQMNGIGSNVDRERERERERFREIRERENLGIQTDEHGQDMVEFEERIRRELKHLDVLGPEEVSNRDLCVFALATSAIDPTWVLH